MSNTTTSLETEMLSKKEAVYLMQLAVPLMQFLDDIQSKTLSVDGEDFHPSYLANKTLNDAMDLNGPLSQLNEYLQQLLDPSWQESLHEWIDSDPLYIFVEEKA